MKVVVARDLLRGCDSGAERSWQRASLIRPCLWFFDSSLRVQQGDADSVHVDGAVPHPRDHDARPSGIASTRRDDTN